MDVGWFRSCSIGPSLLFFCYEEKIVKQGNFRRIKIFD